MELKLVIKTGRSAVVEFDDGGKYYSKEEYTLLINGEEYGKTEKNMDLLNLRRIMNM